MDVAHNKAVVARFDELGNSGGDLTVLESLCTPDMVNHALAAGRAQGLEGTREFLRNAGRATHPGRWISSVVVAEGDMVVQFGPRELHWPGGSFMGFDVPQASPPETPRSPTGWPAAGSPNGGPSAMICRCCASLEHWIADKARRRQVTAEDVGVATLRLA